MTLEQYNHLPDKTKKELLIDAKKVGEYETEIATYELFQIDDFYVEASKSVSRKFRTIVSTHALHACPAGYLGRYNSAWF